MTDDKEDTPVDDVWPVWAASLKPRISQRQQNLFEEFAEWMSKHAKAVWEGMPSLTMDNEAHAAIRKSLASTARSGFAELAIIDWWDRLIAAGNQLSRWEIPLLPPVVRLPRERPAFVPKDFLLLQNFRTLEWAFQERLQKPLESDELLNAILCSAMIAGGVTSRPMLRAIASLDPESISGHRGEIRVVLRWPVGKTDFREHLWYPDAITSVLITRALKHGCIVSANKTVGEATDNFLAKKICGALKSLHLPLFNFSDFLRAAKVAISLSVPPYIAAYLADEFPCQSLKNDVLRRLCGWTYRDDCGTTESEIPETKFQASNFIDLEFPYNPRKVRVDQLKVIGAVAQILERNCDNPIEQINTKICEHGPALWPVTRLLLEWTKWLLGGYHDKSRMFDRNTVVQSTARRYLRTIGRHLVVLAGDENLLEMDAEDFESLYELSAARVIHGTERGNFWARISSFHSFLMLAGASPVEIAELDGFESVGAGQVSANLVSEEDFQAFKRAILGHPGWGQEMPAERILLAAVLGFRCGLRRREIQMLLLHDVHPEPDPYLVVRSSEFARLKSHSAHRRLPLKAIVPNDELKLLLEYVGRRKATLDETTSGLVFSRQGDPRAPLSDSELFAPITVAFQAIIGLAKPRFRFHHLRHSFANWLFLALVRIDNPELLSKHDRLAQCSPFTAERLNSLTKTFFPRLLGIPPAPTKKNLYIISGLLGHLSPLTTVRCYLHLCDWLSGREADLALASRLSDLGSRQLAALCELSPSMPHKPPYRELLHLPVAFMRRYVSQQLPDQHRESVSRRPAPEHQDLAKVWSMLANPEPPPPVTLMGILYRFFKGEDPGRLARRYAVSERSIKVAAQNYQRLYAKQSTERAKKAMRPPGAPRQKAAAAIFWSILDRASNAYHAVKPERREAMVAAARLLIQRNGPRTGRLYFGDRQESALQIVNGLIGIGLPADKMSLEIRLANNLEVLSPVLKDTVTEIEKLGVALVYGQLDWPKRQQKSSLLRLHFQPSSKDASIREKTYVTGQISAINYAALWILFIVDLYEHLPAHSPC
jgi:integrase